MVTSDVWDLFYDLVKSADVVLNNFSAGVVSKLKIDFESLKTINPKIVSCSITGLEKQARILLDQPMIKLFRPIVAVCLLQDLMQIPLLEQAFL